MMISSASDLAEASDHEGVRGGAGGREGTVSGGQLPRGPGLKRPGGGEEGNAARR